MQKMKAFRPIYSEQHIPLRTDGRMQGGGEFDNPICPIDSDLRILFCILAANYQ